MGRYTLSASPEGIQLIKKALKKKEGGQTYVAGAAKCSRTTVWKLLKGNSIDSDSFMNICQELGLNWEQITRTEAKINPDENINIDSLVQQLREEVKADIEERCGTMRVLDMTQPIGLSDIYTTVNILEKIIGRRRKEIAELLQDCNLENFERFGLSNITEKRVSGLDAVKKHKKLLILGKPGAGKTTFLKYLAILCNRGEDFAECVPIFVTLKDFAEATDRPGLLEYISRNIRTPLQQIISQGKALILLDGLDEVREEDSGRILTEIRDFANRFSRNQIVMTCRIAAREYTFEKFTEVEIADFDTEQIASFANNWFKHKAIKPETFLQRLEDNEPIQELATNPLLLTLLCLTFEESGDFPANRSELYKEGLDALLKKWDAKRGIQRHNVYKKLSVQRKEDLLSQIALATFVQKDYFFKQKIAERYITNYIRNLPGANTDEEALQLDSEKVLSSVEAQHGLLVARAKNIYSFSHLTFHEYFTAREIVIVQQSSEEALKNLVNHVTENRWREVFLLAVGMSPNAERLLLLIKEKIDGLVAEDAKIQQFLTWLDEKARSVNITYKPDDVEKIAEKYGFYVFIDLSLSRNLYLDLSLSLSLSRNLYLDLSLSLSLSRNLYLNLDLDLDLDLDLFLDLYLYLYLDLYLDLYLYLDLSRTIEISQKLNPKLHQELKKLKEKLPDNKDEDKFRKWWEQNAKNWSEELRAIAIQYRNIGHDWQFNDEQKELLKQYYFANQLLTQCLHSDCYASREVRQEIEETLFLPMAVVKGMRGEG